MIETELVNNVQANELGHTELDNNAQIPNLGHTEKVEITKNINKLTLEDVALTIEKFLSMPADDATLRKKFKELVAKLYESI